MKIHIFYESIYEWCIKDDIVLLIIIWGFEFIIMVIVLIEL